MKTKYRYSPLIIYLLFVCNSFSQPVFLKSSTISWADSVFNSLTPKQRIGQLFMVAAYSNEKTDTAKIKKLINNCGIGGIIFFQGGPYRQVSLTNYYQSLSKVPLMISIDAEWGLDMRIDSTVRFPRQMTLGAIPPKADSLIYLMGKEIARQCKLIGIHVNLAPVVDINNNPMNPVIGTRSFGENKYDVTRKSLLYMKGLQDGGILAVAKHFPGHGDTDSDSHKTLPTVFHSKEKIDTLDLYPFKELIKQGVGGVMVAHLFIPAYDTTRNIASTLSSKIVNDLLKNELKFQGLIFTDALNMKGVSKYFKPGEVDVKSLLAGNDVLLFSEDVPKAVTEIIKAIERKEITQEEVDARCKKILLAKQWCGLNKYSPIDTTHLFSNLNSEHSDYLNILLAENSVTLLKNKNNLIPLRNLDTLKIATVTIRTKGVNNFLQMLRLYSPMKHFFLPKEPTDIEIDSLLKKLNNYNLIIIDVSSTNNDIKHDFGITKQSIKFIMQASKRAKVIVDFFANPYSLTLLDSAWKSTDAIIMSYENTASQMSLSSQLIFGGISSKGKLPITASQQFPLHSGINSDTSIRFKYTVPEELDIDSKKLSMIDSIVMKGINEKAFPGCQVFLAKNRKVFYYKTFGYHTYENKSTVKKDDIYDLASVTKIASTTAAVMKLVDEKKK
ncbi:MAG: glycoside hydrolase family 3 N-terminal domain-containing protein [Bacteroidota bacterium]